MSVAKEPFLWKGCRQPSPGLVRWEQACSEQSCCPRATAVAVRGVQGALVFLCHASLVAVPAVVFTHLFSAFFFTAVSSPGIEVFSGFFFFQID